MLLKDRQQRSTVFITLGISAVLCATAVLINLSRDKPLAPEVRALVAPNCSESGLPAQKAGQSFSIAVQTEAAALPAGMEENIALGADLAYLQWRDWLGEEALLQSQIDLRFVGDAKLFRHIYGKPNADDWTTTGFYRMRSNQALILYTPAYRASALGNAFHEVSHLITAAHLGATPPWLNEGLAEYYETLEVIDDTARFGGNPSHLALLQRQGALPLMDLTALSRQAWMQEDAQRRYASAWSLISFMMQSQDGQDTLRGVVNQAYALRCDARPDLRETLARYPGGLPTLQSNWLAWLEERFALLSQDAAYTAP